MTLGVECFDGDLGRVSDIHREHDGIEGGGAEWSLESSSESTEKSTGSALDIDSTSTELNSLTWSYLDANVLSYDEAARATLSGDYYGGAVLEWCRICVDVVEVK